MPKSKGPYIGLFEYLKLHHMKQSDIAKILGDSVSSINLKMNRRYGRDFSFQEAYRLQKILGITSSDFFGLHSLEK